MVETRRFQDDDGDGTWWEVREINDPSLAVIPARLLRRPEFASGWLLFTSTEGVRRRFAPVPEGWHETSDAMLSGWCRQAMKVPRTRTSRPGPEVSAPQER